MVAMNERAVNCEDDRSGGRWFNFAYRWAKCNHDYYNNNKRYGFAISVEVIVLGDQFVTLIVTTDYRLLFS